jgi:hypothetical protein
LSTRQNCDKGRAVAEPIALAELGFRILLLPPISRGAHLGGPKLHAQRLVKLWAVDDTDDVPLAQAFRLLNADAVAGAIWRTWAAKDYPGDPRFWTFPNLTDLLPELYELCWLSMLDGTFLVEAIKGLRGKRSRTVAPVELPRLRPDWPLSRLCQGERDEFVDARVRRAPAEPIAKRWRKPPDKDDLKAAMEKIAKDYPEGADPPPLQEVQEKLKGILGEATRRLTQSAIEKYVPQLKGRRGYHGKIK